jgi:hypothetical protein
LANESSPGFAKLEVYYFKRFAALRMVFLLLNEGKERIVM